MRQLTPKRLTAWLLTFVMALSLLPAAALADEVDEDLSPPAPQDYGYVRLVFSEGEQLDLHHGEYITECSPTAAVFGNASEDFITNGEYAALYYEGKLYHKAALDGVSINADAVLPAEDFALVPMGELAAQATSLGEEPVALTNEETTGGTNGGTIGGTTQGTIGGTNGGTNGGTTEGTNGGTNGGTTQKTTGEQQLQQETLPPPTPVRKIPLRTAAASGTSGAVRFIFERDGYGSDQTIRLNSYSYEYITECTPGATVHTVEDQYERYNFITTGNYVAYMFGSDLYLKGNLNGACINLDQVSGSTAVVYVQEDTTIGGNHCLLYNFQGNIDLRIRPGKKLTLNAQTPGEFRYMGAIRANDGGNVTISGGGTLEINATGSTEAVDSRSFLSGIRGSNVTLENCTAEGFEGSPTVNILMDNRYSGPEGDKVIGISAGKLTVKDDTKLRINVYGRALNTSNDSNTGEGYYGGNGGRSNSAINASSMELLNNASLTIFSHKNVISDICLGGSGEVLTVDTSGYLNIRNDGNIERYALDGPGANDAMLATYKDYPTSNIYCSDKDATVNLARAEGGVSIVSYSADIDKWYEEYYEDGKENADNWAISCHGADPQMDNGMHRGNLRIGDSIKVAENQYFRNWGSIEYIWAPQGVATVQQSKGLIMGWHAPEDNPHGSSLYYAKVLKPELNDIHVVRKGESIELTSTGTKGKFLCWYDAQHPEGSVNGTDWTNPTQTFSNIQQDMVLVPVRDPMTTGPDLSDVGYSEQYDSETSTYTRYAYQDLTFAEEDSISNGTGGYRVMLVPAQLPRYGENTYAVKDLKNSPVMGLRSSRLYADANAAFSVSELNNQFRNIPPGRSYRIAYDDDETGRCFFSEPFTFNPPVAPPYIAPGSAVFEEKDSGTKQVKITVERNKHIEYRVWNSSTNKWTNLQTYTVPFEVNVSTGNDVRIEAYAGSRLDGIKSEAYYSVRPSGVPTVKYGDKVLSTVDAQVPTYSYFGAIELTVEAPEGYEVWYRENYPPSESDMGTEVKDGKVVISGTGESSKTIYFKLAKKVVTVYGKEVRSLSHSVTKVNLKELTADTLPVPEVTVTPKSGGTPLTPNGNTYTIKEFVNVALAKSYGWPLNATLGYAYRGDTAPQNAVPYTKPFEVRSEQTVSVFALASNADGSIAHQRWLYQFKVDPSVKKVLLVVRNATAYDSDGNVLPNTSTSGVNVSIGARIKVVPTVPSGMIFKNWSCGRDIYDTPNDKFKEELFFTMPDISGGILVVEAEFADQSEAYITADTKVLLTMGPTPQYNGDVLMYGTVGDSVDLFINQSEGVDYHALRTISYQWWEGESVGTDDNALSTLESFDKSKTYTVKVTITANKGTKFADYAGVQFGTYGSFLKMKDVTRSSGGKTLTFVATPLREMNLTLPTLHEGDSLSKVQESFNTQLSPMGYEVEQLTWESGTPAIAGSAGTNYRINTLKLKLNQNRPLRDNKVVIDGTYCFHKSDSNGSLVVVDGSKTITVSVKSKGVSVSGTVTSYGDAGENVTVTLTKQGETAPAVTDTLTGASGTAPYSQTYSFATVSAGTYTLKVEKKGHAPFTKEITVGDSNVTENVTIYLIGDVNMDGKIDADDVTALLRHVSGIEMLSSSAVALGNVNGDSNIDADDVTKLLRYVSGIIPNLN